MPYPFATLMKAGIVAVLLAACAADETEEQTAETPSEDIVSAAPAEAEEVAPLNENIGPAYVGKWASEGANCALTPGAGETAPIALTQGEFIADGNNCIIAVAEEAAEAGWSMELVCIDAEGVEDRSQVNVQVVDDVMTLSLENAADVSYSRCQ